MSQLDKVQFIVNLLQEFVPEHEWQELVDMLAEPNDRALIWSEIYARRTRKKL